MYNIIIMLPITWLVTMMVMIQPTETVDRGVQVRITKKATEYALDVELAKMKADLLTKSFDQSKSDGKLTWGTTNTRISELNFPSKSLHPVAGHGIRASVYNAYIRIGGRVHYRYKRKWFSISDSIGVTVKARRIRFDLTFEFGRDSKGVPTIRTTGCSSDLDVDVDFHGGKAWIYNMFASKLESKLKSSLQGKLCRSAQKGINENARKKLASFAVTSRLNDWAEIDYSLTANPVYTDKYMDVFLRGEIKEQNGASQPSSIPFVDFATPDQASTKMIYMWISEYTLNTAAKTYHNAGKFNVDVNVWDKDDPDKTRAKLNTKFLKLVAPQLYKKYPDMPIGMHITSYRAPFVKISPEGVRMFIFVRALFKVRDVKQNKLVDVLGVNFNINASMSVSVANGKIIPKLATVPLFKFEVVVDKPFRNLFEIALNSRFVYGMLYRIIFLRVNSKLEKEYDLPKLDDVNLQNFEIHFQNGALQLGADIGVKDIPAVDL